MLPRLNLEVLHLLHFLPELLICVLLVFLLLVRLARAFDNLHLGGVALAFTVIALALSLAQWLAGYAGATNASLDNLARQVINYGIHPPIRAEGEGLLGGLIVYDHLTVYLRIF